MRIQLTDVSGRLVLKLIHVAASVCSGLKWFRDTIGLGVPEVNRDPHNQDGLINNLGEQSWLVGK